MGVNVLAITSMKTTKFTRFLKQKQKQGKPNSKSKSQNKKNKNKNTTCAREKFNKVLL
jgi:hypothetical protein